MQVALATDMVDQLEMLTRRIELMAVEALRTGSITVTGEDYPTQVVNFGRAASLTKALTSAARWGETGVSPLDSLRTWSLEVAQASGATANVAIMDTKANEVLVINERVPAALTRAAALAFHLSVIPEEKIAEKWRPA